MATRRHLENPPPVSSTDEEDDEFTDSEQNDAFDGDAPIDDAEFGDREPSSTKNPRPDSISDSEPEGTPRSPTLSGFTIKPIVSDCVAVKPKKPSSKSGSKRVVAESEIDESKTKKRKKSSAVTPFAGVGGDEDPKKGSGASQRLWSEDDEIAILKGMSEYKVTTGYDPNSDSGAFYEFVKDSLHVEVSKNQLMDKIRRLKKKFRVNTEKGKNGEDPVFSKPHEAKAYELSKKIWSKSKANDELVNNDNASGGKKKSKQSKKSKDDVTLGVGHDKPLSLNLSIQESGAKKHGKKAKLESVAGANAVTDGVKAILECKEVVESKVNAGVNGNVGAENKIDDEIIEEAGDDDDVDEFSSQRRNMLSSLDYLDSHGLLGPSKSFLRLEISRVGGEKAKALNDKWKKLIKEELVIQMKRIDYMGELAKALLDL